jgi:hypothetical protein
MKIRTILKEAVILLLTTLLVTSTLSVANTSEKQPTLYTTETGITSPSSTSKGVVWDNGIDYKVGVLAAQFYPGDLDAFPVDDFQFNASYMVDSVFWQGGYYNCQYASGGKDYNFPWNITFYTHNATGDKPGAVYKTYSFQNASITRQFWYTTNVSSRWYANFSVTLSPPVLFVANTPYWISIYAYNQTFPQAGWSRHNETIGGIKLHQGMFKSAYFGYPDWINASLLLAGVKQDFNYQLGGAIAQVPNLKIDAIKGPIGVTAVINNTGNADATKVSYNIDVNGKLIFFGKHKLGNLTKDIKPGETAKIKSFVMGFGAAVAYVNVTCNEGVSATANKDIKVLLFFVF